MKKLAIIFCFLIMILTSCRKDLQVDIPDYKQLLVVEGSIEKGQFAKVNLSYSVPYFGSNTVSNLSDFAVKGAFVTVSDGVNVDTLKELLPGVGYIYYGSKILGQQGGSYRLDITVNGKNYYSQTQIYSPVALDSLWFKVERMDTLGFVWANLNEPPGRGNHYRWFTKRMGKDNDFIAPFNSAFDDKFIDGKDFDFAYGRPIPQNSTANEDNNEEKGFFKIGDQVIVKFCSIGNEEYLFFRTYYSNLLSNGNPFSAPANVNSNIEGEDVIGVWCGYNPVIDTVICQ
jgi:hypothetical protein